MIIDAMDILYSGNVEGFCLVSSDSDFTKLAQRLRESGMFVLGMGEQKTPSSFRVACDAFKILEIISQNEDDISPAITAVSENPARYGTSQDETPSITSKAEIERTVSRVLTENNDHGKIRHLVRSAVSCRRNSQSLTFEITVIPNFPRF